MPPRKKRRIDELRELQAKNDDLKLTTPVGTTDWYVKWVATFLSVSGIFLMSARLVTQGQVPYAISAAGWTFVGVKWGNRAIMIGSSISATAVAMDLVRALTNWRQQSAWRKSRVEESQSTSAASVTSPTVTYNVIALFSDMRAQ